MTQMLASVRNAEEARLAFDGGAQWIDIKDPEAGALGAADIDTVAAVVEFVGGRRPVSATLGDTWRTPELIPGRAAALADSGLDFIKAGLDASHIDETTAGHVRATVATAVPVVIVCRAESPPGPDEIEILAACGVAAMMLDTASKSGPGLTRLITPAALSAFVAKVQSLGLLAGLAGRLRAKDVGQLTPYRPDYLGFRGALCGHGDRLQRMQSEAITAIVGELDRAIAKLDSTPSLEMN